MRRWPLRGWIVLGLGLLAACAATRGRDIEPSPQRQAQAAWYERLVHDLASPRMEGRGPGTAGLDRARDYLVAEFERLGLRPAFANGFLQPFEIDLGVSVERQSLQWSDVANADDGIDADHPAWHEAEADRDFVAVGLSANGGFEGRAVFVGYGIVNNERDYDSFAGLDEDGLRGRVAIALRYEPQDNEGRSRWSRTRRWSDAAGLANKARAAAERGASALLVVNPPSQDGGRLRPTRQSVRRPAADIPVVQVSPAWLGQVLKASGIDDADAFLRQMQRRADRGRDQPLSLDARIRGQVQLTFSHATLHNVAALLPGRGALAEQVIVLGAHYDHLGYGEIGSIGTPGEIHPGADDNASGTAGIILLAQRLQQRIAAMDEQGDRGDRRTVLLALFSGEERGLLGSAHMVGRFEDIRVPGLQGQLQPLAAERIVAMINLDMIGRLRDGRLSIFGTGSGDRWDELLREASDGLGLRVQRGQSPLGPSDHTSFYYHNIPVLHFFTGIHEDYHRPTDTADKINVSGALQVLDMVQELTERLWRQPQRLAFVAVERDPHAGMTGVGVGPGPGGGALLGILPDYQNLDGDGGCRVIGVSPGSPAEKAGLQGDDVIIGWDDQPIANIRTLTAALHEAQPGQDVTLTIDRHGQRLAIPVTLGRR